VSCVGVKGVPHSRQNLACGGLSCWHRGHRIPSVSRVRIVSACQGLHVTTSGRRRTLASRLSLGFGSPDPTPTRPRALDGRFWRGSLWSLWGDTLGGSAESELTATPHS